MKTTKLIPFDWEYYQANKDKCRVVTSHPEPIEIYSIVKFDVDADLCIVGICDRNIESWNFNGTYFRDQRQTKFNLQLEVTEEVVESWVNVYENEIGIRYTSNVFGSEKLALGHTHSAESRYIATIPLHTIKKEGGEK